MADKIVVMNAGRVERAGAPGVTLPLPTGATPADNAVYGIRPEHLALAETGIPAIVTLVEPMGSETQVTMTVGEHQVIGVFRERLKAQPGDIIHLRPDLANLHLFDAASGNRIN